MATILYLNMSNSKDHSKIDFLQFINPFLRLLDEVKDTRNRAIFDILDIRKKGQLDIVFLLQLLMKLDRESYFAQEILKLIREFKCKNMLLKGGVKRRIVLNFTTFNTLVPNSCLIKDFQKGIFGI